MARQELSIQQYTEEMKQINEELAERTLVMQLEEEYTAKIQKEYTAKIKLLEQQFELQMRQKEEENAKIQLEMIDEHIACNIKVANIGRQQVNYETCKDIVVRGNTDVRVTKVLSVNFPSYKGLQDFMLCSELVITRPIEVPVIYSSVKQDEVLMIESDQYYYWDDSDLHNPGERVSNDYELNQNYY